MSGLGRSLSTRVLRKPEAKEGASSGIPRWTGPSHIRTYIRVLCLLDFDKLDDWPDLSEATFSARVAQQNLQQRIKGTEWSLYRLFECWDQLETQNKLKPFFPPLAPLQSKNLRAALFRSLADLKRDGVLGKEVNLRKTMLDECKGEKFEEVLSSFSMAVLRKHASKKGLKDDTTVRLALADQLTPIEEESLLPLILSQNYSLRKILMDKKECQQVYEQRISELERNLAFASVRLDEVKNQKEKLANIPNAEKVEANKAARSFEEAWTGDPRWLTDILYSFNDTLGFDSQIDGPRKDFRSEAEESLSKDLERRIASHQIRLQEWKRFKASLVFTPETSRPHPGDNVRPQAQPHFDQHQALTLTSSSEIAGDHTGKKIEDEYTELSTSLFEQISSIRRGERKQRVGNSDVKSITDQSKDTPAGKGLPNLIPGHGASIDFFSPVKSETSLRDRRLQNNTALSLKSAILSHPSSPSRGGLEASNTENIDKSPVKEHQAENTFSPQGMPSSPPIPVITQTPSVKTSTRLPIETLLERTRQSMSILPNPSSSKSTAANTKQKSRLSTRNSTMRPSIAPRFPVNQFETPPEKKRERQEEDGPEMPEPMRQSFPSSPLPGIESFIRSPRNASSLRLSPFASTGLPRSPPGPLSPSQGSPFNKSYNPSSSPSSPSLPIHTSVDIRSVPDYLNTPRKRTSTPNSPTGTTSNNNNNTTNDRHLLSPTSSTPDNGTRTDRGADRGIGNSHIKSTASTPRASLFSDDADQASVFKSRPKVKMSPLLKADNQSIRSSPVRGDHDGGKGRRDISELGLENSPDHGRAVGLDLRIAEPGARVGHGSGNGKANGNGSDEDDERWI